MKHIFLFTLISILGLISVKGQHVLTGKVLILTGAEALPGASVRLKNSGSAVSTNKEGLFVIELQSNSDTLVITHIGFLEKRLPVNFSTSSPLTILLAAKDDALEEVEINTGFYQIPKERATGSFAHVDNQLLNRNPSPNILERLEGLVSGVQFVKSGSNDPADIRVRGLATIQSDETPLIVLDNFPYEGNLNSINPNDIESITVLKDAAAASIWGARAGNGVIVITSKAGRYNQKSTVSFNASSTFGEKPDLFYNQNRLPSATIMEIEKELYEHGGYYLSAPNEKSFPAYVELLIKKDNNAISNEEFLKEETLMRQTEVRDEALKYLYQTSIIQQYSLGVKGGGEAYRYYFSTGYDRSRSDVIGNGSDRLNLNLQNSFQPLKGMELTAGIGYFKGKSENNGLSLDQLTAGNPIHVSPYMRLVDDNGNHLPIIKNYRQAYVEQAESNGLLDWSYRPLDEVKLADNVSSSSELRFNGGLRYSFLTDFNVNATYQYVQSDGQTINHYNKDSYYARNVVNQFTAEDGTQVIPHNGILLGGRPSQKVSHSGRAQLNFNKHLAEMHTISALVGGEVREHSNDAYPGYLMYSYDSDLLTSNSTYNNLQYYPTNPTSFATIPNAWTARDKYIDRYLSYFGNASYIYKDRYIFSSSARWDGSNLFGVKTNQKGTPLWSVGGSWELSKESFYNSDIVPYLRMRMTYGSSGNVNKKVSTFPVAFYSTASNTGLNYARLESAGNPSLRWERVNTWNVGVDFRTKNQHLTGSFDYYIKKANDLIGADNLAPNTGIIKGGTAINTNLVNYANLNTKGFDVQMTSQNLQGVVKWQTTVLLNYVQNKVTNYKMDKIPLLGTWFSAPLPVVGKSRDAVYALPWYGLDHNTGYPVVYIDGERSMDYNSYYGKLKYDDLLLMGVSVPPLYGTIRNMVRWKNLTVDFIIGWKSGYVFRRKSMSSGNEYSGIFYMDYFRRWEKPGDESSTYVPVATKIGKALPGSSFYSDTEILISEGDHIRLHDTNFSYSVRKDQISRLPMYNLRISASARNLGVLWKSNKNGVDPDYATSDYPMPKTFTLGIQADF